MKTLKLITFMLVSLQFIEAYGAIGFYSFDQLPKEALVEDMSKVRNAAKSSVLLWVKQGERFYSCSAQFISNEGHILTGGHCLRVHLDKNASEALGASRFSDEAGIDHWLEFSNQTPDNLELEIVLQNEDIHNNKIGKYFFYGKAKVLITGKAYPLILGDNRQHIDIPASKREKTVKRLSDYSILKLEMPIPESDFCVQVRNSKVSGGEPVWGIGYPSIRSRENHSSSRGDRLYYTYGKTVETIGETLQYEQQYNSVLNEIWYRDNFIFSDIDSYSRMSGSMLIDHNGSVIGVNVFALAEDPNLKDLSSISTPITSIIKEVKHLFGDEKMSEIFNCSSL